MKALSLGFDVDDAIALLRLDDLYVLLLFLRVLLSFYGGLIWGLWDSVLMGIIGTSKPSK